MNFIKQLERKRIKTNKDVKAFNQSGAKTCKMIPLQIIYKMIII